jgi:hypothetical protein
MYYLRTTCFYLVLVCTANISFFGQRGPSSTPPAILGKSLDGRPAPHICAMCSRPEENSRPQRSLHVMHALPDHQGSEKSRDRRAHGAVPEHPACMGTYKLTFFLWLVFQA